MTTRPALDLRCFRAAAAIDVYSSVVAVGIISLSTDDGGKRTAVGNKKTDPLYPITISTARLHCTEQAVTTRRPSLAFIGMYARRRSLSNATCTAQRHHCSSYGERITGTHTVPVSRSFDTHTPCISTPDEAGFPLSVSVPSYLFSRSLRSEPRLTDSLASSISNTFPPFPPSTPSTTSLRILHP